ncbi:Ig-like domain-containing protein [Taibaiella soli]|uniref:SbsA Ig-like domain-containing protein n=1 Tax=Taibaiella soli TaxID=1649169 RepID=A0A2W2BJA5_9BACT|nr:Ig-like domain-containing protein [Taibaiella soli]PZF73526.1 hypothetical protein DN068_07315 [Taibaiella soli]
MTASLTRLFLFSLIICLVAGCANIVPPTGGKKDVTPPKLVEITPADSQRHQKVSKIVMRFDEYVTVSDISTQVHISPLIDVPLKVVGAYKHVTVSIPDSLLEENTTYRISFGNAIKDLHEGNPFANYVYSFTTGDYFDSLKIRGKVFDASTGLPDSSATIMLYLASTNDSAIARKKPMYVNKVNGDGSFEISGLPEKSFRIYAVRDKNGNLIYDGISQGEWVGFANAPVTPQADSVKSIELRTFPEGKDTTKAAQPGGLARKSVERAKEENKTKEGFSYIVAVDTNDVRKRTAEITKPITVTFNKAPESILHEKIFLSYDSSGVAVESPTTVDFDTATHKIMQIHTNWKENSVYTLRLIKGFAKDSAGADVMPSKYVFRSKRDDDYGILDIHLPTKYYGNGYVLQVMFNAKDTIYQKPVLDTMVHLPRLTPGTYTFSVIVDSNKNGIWDSGDLFGKKQPELVIPYNSNVTLKPGWQNIIDFDEKKRK